jgi:hypothetical protein
MSKRTLFGGKITKTGSHVGHSATFESVYNSYSAPGTVAYVDGEKCLSDKFETSIFAKIKELYSLSKKEKNIIIHKLSDKVMSDPTKTFWCLLNYGMLLTCETGSSGNVQAIMNNSIGSVFFEFAETPNTTTKQNLLSCLQWYMCAFNYMISKKDDDWSKGYDAFILSLKSPSVTNVLRQLVPATIMKMRKIKVDGIDDWKIFSLIMTSMSRTYHDLKKDMSSSNGLDRLFVLYLILSIPDNSIEKIVDVSMDNFVSDYEEMNKSCSDKNVCLIALMIRKIFSSSIEESLTLARVAFNSIKVKKIPFLSKSDIRKSIEEEFTFNGETIEPFDVKGTFFKFGSCVVNESSKKSSTVQYKDASNWSAFAIDLDKIIETHDEFTISIQGNYDDGALGNPGVRFYCLDTDTHGIVWRKKKKFGVTTNGGFSDGYGRPSGNLKPIVKTDFKQQYKHLATIRYSEKKMSIKFYNWTNYRDISYSSGEDLVIAMKAFKLKSVINIKEKKEVPNKDDDIFFSEIIKSTTGDILKKKMFG